MTVLRDYYLKFCRINDGMEVSEYAVCGVIIAFVTMAAFIALSGAITQWVTGMTEILTGLP